MRVWAEEMRGRNQGGLTLCLWKANRHRQTFFLEEHFAQQRRQQWGDAVVRQERGKLITQGAPRSVLLVLLLQLTHSQNL